jgi:Rad3-related DNA helicase
MPERLNSETTDVTDEPRPSDRISHSDPLSVDDVLGPGSPLARSLVGYEQRDGQLEMARAVHRALEKDQHLFVEAGTGTGKTFAYLVPAVLSGRKVVISTATHALQEQIFEKDLPFVRKVLKEHGVELRAALMIRARQAQRVCSSVARRAVGNRHANWCRMQVLRRMLRHADAS